MMLERELPAAPAVEPDEESGSVARVHGIERRSNPIPERTQASVVRRYLAVQPARVTQVAEVQAEAGGTGLEGWPGGRAFSSRRIAAPAGASASITAGSLGMDTWAMASTGT